MMIYIRSNNMFQLDYLIPVPVVTSTSTSKIKKTSTVIPNFCLNTLIHMDKKLNISKYITLELTSTLEYKTFS